MNAPVSDRRRKEAARIATDRAGRKLVACALCKRELVDCHCCDAALSSQAEIKRAGAERIMIIPVKRKSRRNPRREWRRYVVVFPRLLFIEERGWCWVFLEEIEARRSVSRGGWIYRRSDLPGDRVLHTR